MRTAVVRPSLLAKASMILLVGIVLLVGPGSAFASSQDRPAATEIRQAIGDVSVFWDEFDWGDLTCGEQALWRVLGWDMASWQGETQYPVSEFKTWRDITEREQAAAVLLGYSEELWDADPEGFWSEFSIGRSSQSRYKRCGRSSAGMKLAGRAKLTNRLLRPSPGTNWPRRSGLSPRNWDTMKIPGIGSASTQV